jgi:hypothetical protein
MWREDLCESSEVEASSCRGGGTCALISLAAAVLLTGAAVTTSFLLFLKLNFFGGSKVFLTSCSFSDSPLMAWSLCQPSTFSTASFAILCAVILFIYFSHEVEHSYLTVRPLIICREVTRCVHDLVREAINTRKALVYGFIALAACRWCIWKRRNLGLKGCAVQLGKTARVHGSACPTCDIVLEFAVESFFEVGFGHYGQGRVSQFGSVGE